MDLGAFAQIEDLEYILHEQNIDVPRLRGLRLMLKEEIVPEETVTEIVQERVFDLARAIIEQHCLWCWSSDNDYPRKHKLRYKKNEYGGYDVTGIRWENIHGKIRKWLKFEIKKKKEQVYRQWQMYNSFAGRKDILYVHARIGGNNWNYFNGPKLAKNPYFISRADDSYDSTYCDIYFRIDAETLGKEEKHSDT